VSTPPAPDPVELLRELIRFDTTNPPGNEGPCIDHVRDMPEAAGCPTETYALDPARPNLVSRLRGGGDAPPLLLYGHVDVVTTEGQRWTHPPFEAKLVDGEIWGRGALDMKSGVAMMVSAFVAAAARPDDLPGDLVLAILSDEENLGEVGARFLVEQHPELFESVRFALGEVGGSPLHMGGRRYYMIEVAEKQVCWLNPHDQDLTNLIGELSTQSEEFRVRWARHDVGTHDAGVKRLHHPIVGRLELTYEGMTLAADPDLVLFAFTAEAGSKSEEALNLLASWTATPHQQLVGDSGERT
jgi:MmyB-like transcription regulator ligand binding domain/Peptidase family M20/M25/M40